MQSSANQKGQSHKKKSKAENISKEKENEGNQLVIKLLNHLQGVLKQGSQLQ